MNEIGQQRAEAAMQHEHDTAKLSTFMVSRRVAEQEVLNLRNSAKRQTEEHYV